MRAPLSWLRDFAPFDGTAAELGDALSNLGLVVDGVSHVGHGLDGVVVARIEEVRAHPDADRIRLVDVDAGTGKSQQIVCGASNLHVRDLVALATVGTTLPGGVEIARRKMRGQWSEGMISATDELDPSGELGLPAADGDREILVLPADVAEPGEPLATALDIQPDVVFDLDVTPNRPDALCMAGVARDLAAALGLPFSFPDPGALPPAEPELAASSLRVEAPDLCPRLTATVVTDLPRGSAPPWLARRLALAGMRPISAVVDATNYVMLDLGQPVHAYDLDRLPGRGLLVRRGHPGETMVTLDDVERSLGPDDCVIADAEGVAVGIGGIMGGASSEVSAATTTVLLEAAWFAPQAIARTGNRLGLTSEARARFERGVDPAVAARAAARFVSLLPGCRRGVTDDVVSPAHLPAPATVALRTDRVNAILGTSLDDATVAGYLRPLGFEVTAAGAGVADVIIPTWRPDTEREIDVIEEVARLHGYARIERTLPSGIRTGGGLTARQQQRRALGDVLAGAGLSEAWTTTFLAPNDLARAELTASPVEVANPLDQAESILRPSLLPGLLKAVHHNAARQLGDVRLFEVGRVFLVPGAGGEDADGGRAVGSGGTGDSGPEVDSLPVERERVAAIVAGGGADARLAARIWAVLAGALRLEGARLRAAPVEGLHGGRSALVVGPDGRAVGQVGEVDPDVAARYEVPGRIGYLEVDLDGLLALPRRAERAPTTSRYPASDIDLAFVVAGTVPAVAVEDTLRHAGGELLESIRLFDVYPMPDGAGAGVDEARGNPGARSLAYRLRFRAPDRTLTDEAVAQARQAAIDAVVAHHGARLRS